MSLRRFRLVFGQELSHNTRRIMFWVWMIVLIFFAWALSYGAAKISSGDSSVGGQRAHITSEFGISLQLGILTALIYGFFASVVAGMAVIQDEEHRVVELLQSTSLRPGEYIWGKFFAAMAAGLIVLTVHLVAMMLCNHMLPAGQASDLRGAFHLMNYVRPALLFNVPTVIFMAGVSFAVGEWTRKPVLVFFLPVAVLLGSIFFLWEWSPSWLDPRVDKFLMLIDPAGFRWLTETWLKVDRGVKFYNTTSVPIDSIFLANRLIVTGIGLGAVALSVLHLKATLRGKSRGAERAWARQTAGGSGLSTVASHPLLLRPLSAMGMKSKPPGLLSASWTIARAELTELRSSPGLYLFIPLLVLEAIAPNLIAIGAFDTPVLLTPGTIAERSFGPLTIMVCLLLMFYTVESLSREVRTRLASISMSAPVRTGSILLGKAMGIGLIAAAVVMAMLLAATGFLLYQQTVKFALGPFALLWGLLLFPTVWLWTAFVMAVYSVTKNRYATYAIGLAALIFTGYRQVTNRINWAGNWPMLNAIRWSDISVLEFDRTAMILNRVTAIGLAISLTALTARLYGRRDGDAVRLIHRLRPLSIARAVLFLLPFAIVPLATGGVLYFMVDRGFQGEAIEHRQKDYWRKNLTTYKDWPLPDITFADLDVALEPARGRLKVSGTYDLINNRDKPIRQIPITIGTHWESPKWTLDGKDITPDDRAGLKIVTPPEPLAPGKSLRVGFAFEGTFPTGISKRGGGTGQFILPSGVVLTSFGPAFAPVLGFNEGIGIDDDNKYDSKEYPDDWYKGQTDSAFGSRHPFKTRVKLSGPATFTLNSVGTIQSDKVKDGRRTTLWESDHPVNFLNIVAGKWDVRRGKGTAVFYHPSHTYNIDEMVEALDAAREYYSKWFRPYPWRELKLSEFPALASYAQGFPTDITFSESIGFLTRSDHRADAAFMVTAHESAHQWWGNIIAPGKGPGGNLISEGGAHFSTLLLFEQVRGVRGRIEFSKRIEDSYAKGRKADSERALVKIDGTRNGDTSVTYDKTGFVLWMLLNQMGRDQMLEGLREFFETYHANPDHPVVEDLLASLRPHAADPEAFDAFARQWFLEVALPEYTLSDARRTKDGDKWVSSAQITNAGTGTMTVEVAAVKGERFTKEGKDNPDYREARTTVALGSGALKPLTIRGDFEPEKIVVDPDVKVLQLRRKTAEAKF